MNHNTLLKLAGINNNQDLYEELGLSTENLGNTEFSAALKEIQAEEKKNVIKDAAKEVFELMKHSNSKTALLVDELRKVRRTEKSLLAAIKDIERAKLYAAHTNNYIPLLVAHFCTEPHRQSKVIAEYRSLAFIPEGWEPKAKTTAAKKSVAKD